MFGKCLKFDRAKGFGFLVSTEDPTLPDVFVHFSNIEYNETWKRRFLLPGMKVQFDLEDRTIDSAGEEKLNAKHVRVIPPITIAIQRSMQPTGGAK